MGVVSSPRKQSPLHRLLGPYLGHRCWISHQNGPQNNLNSKFPSQISKYPLKFIIDPKHLNQWNYNREKEILVYWTSLYDANQLTRENAVIFRHFASFQQESGIINKVFGRNTKLDQQCFVQLTKKKKGSKIPTRFWHNKCPRETNP